MRTLWFAAFACICVAAQIRGAEPELRGTPNELSAYLDGLPRTVTLSVEGEAKRPAVRAVVSLVVVTEDRQLNDAVRANREVRGRIMSALGERGIGTNRIASARFSSTAKHTIFREKARSHRMEHTVRITVTNEQEFAAAADLVDSIPQVHFGGVEPELDDREALRREAIAKALASAASRSKAYEEQLNVRLVTRSFKEVITGTTPERESRRYQGYMSSDKVGLSAPSQLTAEEPHFAEVPSGFGEFIYIARLAIDYSIASR